MAAIHCELDTSGAETFNIAACFCDDSLHIRLDLGKSARHLSGQDVSEAPKCLLFAFHQLIAAARELNKFARVDIRITAAVHILDELWWYAD